MHGVDQFWLLGKGETQRQGRVQRRRGQGKVIAGRAARRVERARVVSVKCVGLTRARFALRAAASRRRRSRRGSRRLRSRSRRGEAAEPKAAKAKRPRRPPTRASEALPAARLDAARAALTGEDDAAAVAAAESLGASGAGNAAEPLAELLAAGAAPSRTEAALDALAKLGRRGHADGAARARGAGAVCRPSRARDRQRAIKALGTIKDPRVVPTLMARLATPRRACGRPRARRWRRGASRPRRRACSPSSSAAT